MPGVLLGTENEMGNMCRRDPIFRELVCKPRQKTGMQSEEPPAVRRAERR